MPYKIVRNDIVNMKVDAIVNTANPKPVIGSGTDTAIHAAAGPELLRARQMIGNIERGKSAITPAFKLNAKYVIHTIGPKWIDGDHGEKETLRSAYESALTLAHDFGCKSIAFPLLAAGSYGFPKGLAIQIATDTFESFLYEDPDMKIYLVLFNKAAFELSGRMFDDIQSFIDDNYADKKASLEYIHRNRGQKLLEKKPLYSKQIREDRLPEQYEPFNREKNIFSTHPVSGSFNDFSAFSCDEAPAASYIPPVPDNLEDYIHSISDKDTFSQAMFKIIDEKGWTDPEVYKRTGGNVSRQTMSKMRIDPNVKPKKNTAVMLCIALQLSVEESNALLAKAGYTLSRSDLVDVIIMYFLDRKKYSIVDIDTALYKYDLPTLNKAK